MHKIGKSPRELFWKELDIMRADKGVEGRSSQKGEPHRGIVGVIRNFFKGRFKIGQGRVISKASFDTFLRENGLVKNPRALSKGDVLKIVKKLDARALEVKEGTGRSLGVIHSELREDIAGIVGRRAVGKIRGDETVEMSEVEWGQWLEKLPDAAKKFVDTSDPTGLVMIQIQESSDHRRFPYSPWVTSVEGATGRVQIPIGKAICEEKRYLTGAYEEVRGSKDPNKEDAFEEYVHSLYDDVEMLKGNDSPPFLYEFRKRMLDELFHELGIGGYRSDKVLDKNGLVTELLRRQSQDTTLTVRGLKTEIFKEIFAAFEDMFGTPDQIEIWDKGSLRRPDEKVDVGGDIRVRLPGTGGGGNRVHKLLRLLRKGGKEEEIETKLSKGAITGREIREMILPTVNAGRKEPYKAEDVVMRYRGKTVTDEREIMYFKQLGGVRVYLRSTGL